MYNSCSFFSGKYFNHPTIFFFFSNLKVDLSPILNCLINRENDTETTVLGRGTRGPYLNPSEWDQSCI